jgi:hypothetical protein
MSELARRDVSDGTLVSVVLPLYNEAAALERLFDAVHEALESTPYRFEDPPRTGEPPH